MAINLLAIQPHKVSRDLSGYITYIYGAPKVGKTTLCSKFPSPLLLAFEKGYNAIPGIIAQDVTKWSQMKEVIRELKKDEVKEAFKTIIIDTIDVAGSLCEKYICNKKGIETIGEGGWTNNGWADYKKELEETFRTIAQEGYAVVFISHIQDKTFKRPDGTEYNQMVPTAQSSLNKIVKAMADIYGCALINPTTGQREMVLRSLDGTVDAGCRFKYIEPIIPLGYQELVDALNAAIDKEAAETGGKYVTDERDSVATAAPEYDYGKLMEEFQVLVGQLMNESAQNGPKITAIIDKYLGKGKKISEATQSQVDMIYLIVSEIKSDLIKSK